MCGCFFRIWGGTRCNAEFAGVIHFAQLAEAVRKSQGKTLKLEVWRAGDILKFELTPRKRPLQDGTEVNENWMIGIQAPPIPFDFELVTTRNNWLSSLLNAWTFILLNIENTFIFLKRFYNDN